MSILQAANVNVTSVLTVSNTLVIGNNTVNTSSINSSVVNTNVLAVDQIKPKGSNTIISVPAGYAMYSPGSVMQVQQAVKLDALVSTSTYPTFVDITGLTVNITPLSSTSKIYVMISINGAADSWSGGDMYFNLVRNSTNICVSTAGASFNSSFRFVSYADAAGDTRYNSAQMGFNYLDSPGTTATLTYKVQGCIQAGGYTWCINRRMVNADAGSTSSITVMEIAQ